MSKRMRAMGQQPRADRLRAFERLQKAPKSSKASGPAPSKARTKRSQKLAHCPTVSKPPRAPKEETIDSTAVQTMHLTNCCIQIGGQPFHWLHHNLAQPEDACVTLSM
ncbi:hypothetical protein WJX74_008912 [Apatococcus lobatus]|uniref:Uncharacterized protein n=1 Tax=Apatococcus lobatus TaxID=904363 RepID=A0AAW1R3A9_9CHLO